MIVAYSKSYLDDLEGIKDKTIIRRAHTAVQKLKSANSLRDITNIKYMQGSQGFYRIAFGNYRIGFFLTDENTIRLLAIEHRSVFYRNFP